MTPGSALPQVPGNQGWGRERERRRASLPCQHHCAPDRQSGYLSHSLAFRASSSIPVPKGPPLLLCCPDKVPVLLCAADTDRRGQLCVALSSWYNKGHRYQHRPRIQQTWPSAVARAQMTPWLWVATQVIQIFMALAVAWPLDTNMVLGGGPDV